MRKGSDARFQLVSLKILPDLACSAVLYFKQIVEDSNFVELWAMQMFFDGKSIFADANFKMDAAINNSYNGEDELSYK